MVHVQRYQVPSQQSLAFFLEIPPFFTGVVAGTVGWNCGGGRVAWLDRSQDFSVEKFSAGQVVYGTGNNALPDTRCDPKCGQLVAAVAAVLEDDRLSMVMGAGVLEDDRLSMVSETDAAAVEASSCFWSWRGSAAWSTWLPNCAQCVLGDMRVLNAVFSTPCASSMSSTVRSSRLHVPLLLVTWCVLVGNVLTPRVRVVPHFWERRFRQAHVERAEAGSDNFYLVSSFTCCASHIARSHRVDVTMHENLLCMSSGCRNACATHNSPACDIGVHDAMQRVIRLGWNSGNSFNSWV